MSDKMLQICTFEIDGLRLGLPVADVLEVVRGRSITPVPLAPPAVAGVISLRGEVVTALDSARRLDLEFDSPVDELAHVVVEHLDDRYVLLADRVDELIEVNRENLTFPPATIDRPRREYIDSVVERDDGWIVVLDLESVLDLEVGDEEEPTANQVRR